MPKPTPETTLPNDDFYYASLEDDLMDLYWLEDIPVIPGPLQSPSYAAQVIATGYHVSRGVDGTPEELDDFRRPRLERRLGWLAAMGGAPDERNIYFRFRESSLYEPIGPPEVMLSAAQHLNELVHSPPKRVFIGLLPQVIENPDSSQPLNYMAGHGVGAFTATTHRREPGSENAFYWRGDDAEPVTDPLVQLRYDNCMIALESGNVTWGHRTIAALKRATEHWQNQVAQEIAA